MIVSYSTNLTDINYNEFVSKGLVLVDIWAPWCQPCLILSPLVDEISTIYLGKLTVGKLDADSSKTVITEIGVRNIPTLLLYKDGQIVDKKVGSISKSN